MVPWPRYAEQHLNAFTLVEYMGVALAMEVDRKRSNWVDAAELERAVRALMDGGSDEGRRVRGKAMAMKGACRKAVAEGGSSYSALGRLSEEMINGASTSHHVQRKDACMFWKILSSYELSISSNSEEKN
ncbi:unnamed protein product [Triticum turgidum subsp. durum]|uniref:Glycosyltransferase n=1 Tax=Triticum turgidum subsp. durum TaxID=4567 RepID=A0A9R0V0C5_TRITD|nr:unnamed protein product [Triticum turgidum subsp. durum]